MNDMQSVFDTATSAIILQGKRSEGTVNGEAMCLYRGENGAKCAIGMLLSDADILFYSIKENSNPYEFPSDLIKRLVPGSASVQEAKDFLLDLQYAHDMADNAFFMESFKHLTNCVASKYKLTPIK